MISVSSRQAIYVTERGRDIYGHEVRFPRRLVVYSQCQGSPDTQDFDRRSIIAPDA